MKKMNDQTMWIVYLHENPFNNKKYIGITSQDPLKRWKGGSGYYNNLPFYKDIKKYGWNNFKHKILEENIPQSQIGEREQYYIELYDTLNPNKGYNRAKGGLNPGRLGLQHTKQTKEKISQANSKSILCLNTNTLYKSASKAAEQLNLNFKEVCACCNNNSSAKSANGFYFIYSNKKLTQEECLSLIKNIENSSYQTQKHKVICLETNTIYLSQKQAEKELNICRGSISNCLRGKQKTAGGFHWKEVEINNE